MCYFFQINSHKVFNIISEVRVKLMLIIISNNKYKIFMLLLNTLYIFVLSVAIVVEIPYLLPYLVTHHKIF